MRKKREGYGLILKRNIKSAISHETESATDRRLSVCALRVEQVQALAFVFGCVHKRPDTHRNVSKWQYVEYSRKQ